MTAMERTEPAVIDAVIVGDGDQDDGLIELATPAATSIRDPARLYLAQLRSEESRRTMRTCLGRLAEITAGRSGAAPGPATNSRAAARPYPILVPFEGWDATRPRARVMPWHKLTMAHVAAIKTTLAERYQAATANKHLAALRGVLRAADDLGLMDAATALKRCDDVEGETVLAGREVSLDDKAAVFSAVKADGGPVAARDAAVLALLFGAGLRRAEVAGLTLADWRATEGRLLVRGKGNKERKVTIDNGARRALDDWLRVRGSVPGPLLYRMTADGEVDPAELAEPKGISTQAVYRACQRWAKRAGIERFTPHDGRRDFAGAALDAADAITAARMMGHASADTTMRYDRRGDRAMDLAASKMTIPY